PWPLWDLTGSNLMFVRLRVKSSSTTLAPRTAGCCTMESGTVGDKTSASTRRTSFPPAFKGTRGYMRTAEQRRSALSFCFLINTTFYVFTQNILNIKCT
ncbi:O-fucosyltransferase 1, partial [Clarias magur]